MDMRFDAGVEIVESFALDAWRGQEGVALFAHDGHVIIDRALAVLALVGGVVPERISNVLRLVAHATANRA
jgi:hypothetical protein